MVGRKLRHFVLWVGTLALLSACGSRSGEGGGPTAPVANGAVPAIARSEATQQTDNSVSLAQVAAQFASRTKAMLAPLAGGTAQLGMTITGTPDAVQPGQQIRYQITISNTGTAASSGFSVTLTIPNFTTATSVRGSPAPTSSSCPTGGANGCAPGQAVWWTLASLPAGGSETIDFPVMVSQASPPPDGTTTTITAVLSSTPNGGGTVFGTASSTVTIDSRTWPQLGVSDVANGVVAGGTLSYVLNYGNPTGSAANLSLSLSLPSGTSLVSASNQGQQSGSAVVWNLGTLPAGATGQRFVTLQVGAGVASGTQLQTTANLFDSGSQQSYSRVNRISSVVSVSSTAPLLALSLTATPDPVQPGQEVFYQLTVSNQGAVASTGYSLYFTIPNGTAATSTYGLIGATSSNCPSGSVNQCTPGEEVWWTLPGLAAGASVTVQFPVNVNPTGVASGTVIPAAAVLWTNGVGTSAVQNVVVTSSPTLEMGITDIPSSVVAGGTLSYVVNYGNPSSTPVSASLSLSLPAGTSFVSASNQGAPSGNTVEWDLGTIPAGAFGQRRVTLQVDAGTASGSQLLTSVDLFDTNSLQTYSRVTRVSSVVTISSSAPLLALSLTGTPDPVQPGQQVLYQLTVSNQGGATSGGYFLSLSIPNQAAATSVYGAIGVTSSNCPSGGVNQCTSGHGVWWTLPGLAPGASVTVQFPVNVNSTGVPDGTVIPVSAVLYGNGGANNGIGTTAVQSVGVISSPTLELGITDLPSTVVTGGTLTYVINYGNTSSGAVNASLTLPLPVGTSFVSASNQGALSGDTVTWNLGTVAAGATGQRLLTLQVAAAAGAQLLTTANLFDTGTSVSYARASRMSSVVSVSSSAASLALAVTATPDPVQPGQEVVYQVTVSNQGGATSTGYTVYLSVPNGLAATSTYGQPGATSSSCPNGGLNGCTPGQAIWWQLPALAAGASVTFQFPMNVNATGVPSGSVIPIGINLLASGDNSGVSAVQNTTVNSNPTLQLGISDVASSVTSGGTLSYVLNVGNPTSSSIGASLTLTLPVGTTFVSASNQGAPAGNTVVWNLGTMAAGAATQRVVTLQVANTVGSGAQLEAIANLYDNTSQQSYARASRVSNVVGLSSTAPPLALSIRANPDPAQPGQDILYQLTVSNQGSASSGGFTVYLMIPNNTAGTSVLGQPGVTSSSCPNGGQNGCTPGQGAWWSFSGLIAGASQTIQFPVNVNSAGIPAGTVIPVSAVVIGGSNGGASAVQDVVVSPTPVMTLGIAGSPSTVAPNGTLSYLLSFGNSSSTAVSPGLSLQLPAGTSVVSASDNGSVAGNTVVWTLGSVSPGANIQRRVILQAGSAANGTQLTASANVYSTATQQSYARAVSVTPVQSPPATAGLLAMSMSTVDPVTDGQAVSYQITVTNIGGAASGGFTVYFAVPNGTTATSGSGSPGVLSSSCPNGGVGACKPGQGVWWSGSSLAAGATATFTFPVVVNPSGTGGPPNGGLLTTGATLTDGTNGGGSATAETSIGTNLTGPVDTTPNADTPLPLWSMLLLGAGLLWINRR